MGLTMERAGGSNVMAATLRFAPSGIEVAATRTLFKLDIREYMPTLRARLALLHANPEEALHALEAASPYELGEPATGLYNWSSLYPVYVRGEAYLGPPRQRSSGRVSENS